MNASGIIYENGKKYRYNCDLGLKGEGKISEGNLKDKILLAIKKPGVDVGEGRVKTFDLSGSKCTLIEELVNYIDLNVESNFSSLGFKLAIACLVLLGIGGSSGFLANNSDKLKPLLGFSSLTYFVGLLILIVLSVIPKFKNLQNKLLGDKPHNISLLIGLSVITLISLYIILIPKPEDDYLKENYGGTDGFSKIYYYVDQLFSTNVNIIIGTAILFLLIFLALKIDITIPHILVILIAGTTLVSLLIGSLNGLLSMIQTFKTGSWGLDTANMVGMKIIGLFLIFILFGVDIYLNYNKSLKVDNFKWLYQGDLYLLGITLISSLINLFKKDVIPAVSNKFLSSMIYVIITVIVLGKNSSLVEKMDKDNLSPEKKKLASMTGVFSDILFKLYDVFFGISDKKSEEFSIGKETNKVKSFVWLFFYLIIGRMTQNALVSKVNPTVLRVIIAIISIVLGQLGSISIPNIPKMTSNKNIEMTEM